MTKKNIWDSLNAPTPQQPDEDDPAAGPLLLIDLADDHDDEPPWDPFREAPNFPMP